jgi:hypothetical protein
MQTVQEVQETQTVQEVQKFTPTQVDLNQVVTVRNGFHGKLVYKSTKTGERFVWDSFGDEQDMEIGELRNARNSNKMYFINNWFLFDEAWVVDYLGMGKYYKHALNLDEFDALFTKSVEEINQTIAQLSDGQKRSLAYHARARIADGTIDSNRVINALEKALCLDLVER